ncbi:MAG: YbbR-like domain-containing protein [Acidobacteria bacterium]|nr:YbbR-like domain-containing protein [Acidobacteriota bacterium]
MNIRKPLFDNLGLKAVSLLLAFLLWFNVSSEQVIERTVSVPVEFLNTPSSLEIFNDYTKSLDVHVSTRRGSLSSSGSNISAVVNLRNTGEGEHIIPITEANVRRPEGVTVLNITPSRITLVLERTRSRLVPIEPQIVGVPTPGYQITRVRTNPRELMITGPETRVRKAFKVVTEPIYVSGVKDSIERNVNVDIEDSKLRIDRVTPVEVEVLIEPERSTERLIVPLFSGHGLRTPTRTLELQVSYPKTYRSAVKASMFSLRVDRPVDAVPGEEREVVPQIILNKQVENIVRVDKVTPERVKVRIL